MFAALEEICSQGANGLALQSLWPNLHAALSSAGLDLSSGVKAAIWANLLKTPGLEFQSRNVSRNADDPAIQSVVQCEKLNLKIVAAEHLRDSFVGLYDAKASAVTGISAVQRRVLERLAIARTNGITQSQLCKEFGIKANNMFYVLRNLECRGLIVRQSSIVRTKEACSEGESKNSSIVSTNLIHLYRYGKHLGSQQKLEITKEDKLLDCLGNGDERGAAGDGGTRGCGEEMLIKDYLPAMKAICDKLEEANGKVLVVRDIKQDLGYQGYHGHKSWRNICSRLKDAGLVEEFDAEVNKKVVSCLRLLKKFSPKCFEPKTQGSGLDDPDAEQLVKSGKRGQITDQLVELPMEHQIYDMIDAEGPKGLTVIEVCQRLGINSKANYNRFLNMFSRFGMHLQAESHKRGMAYRVWTAGNFNPVSSNAFPDKSENIFNENGVSNPHVVGYMDLHQKSAQTIQELDPSTLKTDNTTHGKTKNREIEPEPSQIFPGDGECNQMLLCPSNPQEFNHEKKDPVPDAEPDLESKAIEANDALPETSPLALSKSQGPQQGSRRRRLALTAISAQKEQRILEWLQKDKFLLRAEIQKWLESIGKEKDRMMDRKTVARTLNKLQQEGHCKCIQVSVPIVTNCGRTCTKEVILHPSVQSLPPEILGQIHDRMRSFDKQVRGQAMSRLNTNGTVPVLNDVQRTQNNVGSDVQAIRSEAMRANGFILAKMVRAKLLHNFLWAYLCSLPGWDDALSVGKNGYDLKHPHSSCKLLALDDAIKAMPLELFLQVVGSAQKFDDMIEKCKSGLHLSDLPVQEYKCLMDTQATGRLSWIIDILRRLKLIRLVSGHSEDGAEVQRATLKHALELKPYIEEPSLVAPSLCSSFLDLRPKIRHDFILSSREAVDVYWKTLEYCYAAADPAAALHSFPGSAVHEVFLSRSWSSFRVMTADQRAGLLKRIVMENPDKKLSFKDCEKIAKDLSLTLEQVLRVYYDKRQHRLNRFQGLLNGEGNDSEPLKSKSSSSRKRKRPSEARSSKHMKFKMAAGELGKQRLAKLSDTVNQFTEESDLVITSSGEHDINLPAYQGDDDQGTVEELGPEEEQEDCSSVSQFAFTRMKPTRQRRFLWTEKADRQLVMQYVRHRAALGAKFHRIDWSSLPDLPGPPGPCGKRMASLNTNIKFRKAVMRLCNMLSQRYANHLEKTPNKLLNLDDCRQVRGSLAGLNKNLSVGVEHAEASNSEGERWDDFEDKNIKIALDEVIQCKWMSKVESLKQVRTLSEEWSNLNMDAEGNDPHKTKLVSTPGEDVQTHRGRQCGTSGRRSSRRCLPRKFIKILNERISVTRRAHESLAVSNAVELFKLVFLSTSTAPEVPNLLAETLRRYSEHDLISAFNYLREKKIMVGGNGSDPFVLSQQFLQSVSSSPFPTDTGRRAAKFASWLHEREKDLTEEGINLSQDLQCGDIFHLFALVSLGELCLSPRLPDEGVGEAEDSRTSKRKTDSNESSNVNMIKKLKTSLVTEGEIVSRREKGFPGIMVSVSRATMSRTNVVDLFKDGKICTGAHDFEENDQWHVTSDKKIDSSSSHSDDIKEILNFGSVATITEVPSNSPWEAMTAYAQHLISIPPDQGQAGPLSQNLFRTVYAAIKKAGDQGLSMEEISEVMKNMQGQEVPELIVEVLLAFGRVVKVNAYESIHVVDAFYRSKYFLTSPAGFSEDQLSPSKKPLRSSGLQPEHRVLDDDNAHTERSIEMDDVHKVTILNIPEELSQSSSEIQLSNKLGSCMEDKDVSVGVDNEDQTLEYSSADSHSCSPMLPWINGDGSINRIVYKGLTRRVLGTVMQNPGMLEDDIIRQMDIVNPQSCRKLLELLILDNHLTVRKMHQTTFCSPPALLGGLLGSSFAKPKSIFREHYFANPLSASSL